MEEENAKRKKRVADLSLDKWIAQDVLTKKSERLPETGCRTGSAGTLPGERMQKLRYCGSTGDSAGGSRPGTHRPFYECGSGRSPL